MLQDPLGSSQFHPLQWRPGRSCFLPHFGKTSALPVTGDAFATVPASPDGQHDFIGHETVTIHQYSHLGCFISMPVLAYRCVYVPPLRYAIYMYPDRLRNFVIHTMALSYNFISVARRLVIRVIARLWRRLVPID